MNLLRDIGKKTLVKTGFPLSAYLSFQKFHFLAWIPVLLLLAIILVFFFTNQGIAYENHLLLLLLNFLFFTVISALITYQLTKSFFARGSLGILFLAAGVLFWGSGGFAGVIVGLTGQDFANVVVTIHNICVLLAALFHFAGMLMLMHPGRAISSRLLHSWGLYTAVFAAVGFISLLAMRGWLPVFHVQGQGGTLVRQAVLISAICLFLLTALLMGRASRHSFTFMFWYCAALVLIAVGLFGVMIESVHGGVIGWTGRASQYLGGAYMLLAAVLSIREFRRPDIALDTEIAWWREQYQGLFNNIPLGFASLQVLTDSKGQPVDFLFLKTNPAFEIQTGTHASDIVGQSLLSTFPVFRDPGVMSRLGQVVSSQQAVGFDLHLTLQRRYYHVKAYIPREGFMVILLEDVTSRHITEYQLKEVNKNLIREIAQHQQTEKKLKEALDQTEEGHRILRSIMDFMPMGIVVADSADANISMVSKFTNETLGRSLEELTGVAEEHPRKWGVFHVDGLTAALAEELPLARATTRGEVVKNEEWMLTRKDGVKIPVLVNAAPIRNKEGNITGGLIGWQDISDMWRAREELKQSEERFRTLANAIPQLAWIADGKGQIYWYNQRWYDYIGEGGFNWLEVQDTAALPDVARKWKHSLEAAQPLSMEMSLRGCEGTFSPFLAIAIPLKDPKGNVMRWFCTMTDISAQRKNEEELLQRARQLELAYKDQEAFSYSISHDLRSPLVSVMGFTNLILEEYHHKLDPEVIAYLKRIYGSSRKMNLLIDDILNLSKVSRQKINPQPLSLSDIAIPIVNILRQTDPGRQAIVKIAPDMNSFGDKRLLQLALTNLLNNSWKYTVKKQPSRIEFGEKLTPKGKTFYIRDNGAGFDMKHASKLFEPFGRLHHEKEFPGTGIGLSIVKRVIEKHGGKVWAEGKPGKGACFFFTLMNSAPDKVQANGKNQNSSLQNH